MLSCWLTPDLLDFSNGAGFGNQVSRDHHDLLPSFNVRLQIDDNEFVRFGASRLLSRPDFGLLRNYVGIQPPALYTSADSPYVVYRSADAARTPENVAGYKFVFHADAGYGALEPITADNIDLAYENYWGKSSSFTVNLFYKRMNGSIAFGEFDRAFGNNGATQRVLVRGPRNGEGGGTLKGVEVAFQTFFDFLPGAWSGTGTQLNYMLMCASRASTIRTSPCNQATRPAAPSPSVAACKSTTRCSTPTAWPGSPITRTTSVLLHEYGRIGARLAYSWRSGLPDQQSRLLYRPADVAEGERLSRRRDQDASGQQHRAIAGRLEPARHHHRQSAAAVR